MPAGSGSQLFLGLPVTSGTSSLVVLSVTADDLKLTTNRCPGNITSAQARGKDARLVCQGACWMTCSFACVLP